MGTSSEDHEANSSEASPVVMYFHGGGCVLGDIETHDPLCRRLAAESGCAVVSVHYRRAPDHPYPATFDDCYLATKYVSENAALLGVDGTRIVVAGDSAGGNLAATVSLKARDSDGPAIAGQVLLYPVVTPDFETPSYNEFAEGFGLSKELMAWFWRQYLGAAEPNAYSDPTQAASLKNLPPAHVVIAEYDVLRSEVEQYASVNGSSCKIYSSVPFHANYFECEIQSVGRGYIQRIHAHYIDQVVAPIKAALIRCKAAITIQAAVCKWWAKRRLEITIQEAVITIQAGVCGWQARRAAIKAVITI